MLVFRNCCCIFCAINNAFLILVSGQYQFLFLFVDTIKSCLSIIFSFRMERSPRWTENA
uniref:Uncharacterized protein n=1 Tax=Rhizophora mucronata TaxID=61149 RepID=A0A2P2NWE8_RHIMU